MTLLEHLKFNGKILKLIVKHQFKIAKLNPLWIQGSGCFYLYLEN